MSTPKGVHVILPADSGRAAGTEPPHGHAQHAADRQPGGDAAPLDAHWALRALVTYDRWLWERLTEFRKDGRHRWGATLSAYNGGLGNVRKDRQLARTDPADAGERAALRGGPFYTERSERACDPAVSRWFCCVEHHSNRSAAAFRENREYPRRILFFLWPRYQAAGW
jgi:hypothetical protein